MILTRCAIGWVKNPAFAFVLACPAIEARHGLLVEYDDEVSPLSRRSGPAGHRRKISFRRSRFENFNLDSDELSTSLR